MEKKYEVLADTMAFEGIPPERYGEVLEALGAYCRTYARGDLVRRVGDEMDFFGIVLKGGIQSVIPDGGRRQIVQQFAAGSVFGEAVAFSSQRCGIEICATASGTEILHIRAAAFLQGDTNPHIARMSTNLLRDMAGKLLMLNMKVRILGKQRLRSRIADYLLSLDPDATGYLELPFGRTELSEFLGANRSSLSREIKRMQDEGIVEIERRTVHILRREALENASEGTYDMIDSGKKMRQIAEEEPLFADFLVSKGFPFSVDNPVTELVTFDDVVALKDLDKEAFLEEYAEFKRNAGK